MKSVQMETADELTHPHPCLRRERFLFLLAIAVSLILAAAVSEVIGGESVGSDNLLPSRHRLDETLSYDFPGMSDHETQVPCFSARLIVNMHNSFNENGMDGLPFSTLMMKGRKYKIVRPKCGENVGKSFTIAEWVARWKGSTEGGFTLYEFGAIPFLEVSWHQQSCDTVMGSHGDVKQTISLVDSTMEGIVSQNVEGGGHGIFISDVGDSCWWLHADDEVELDSLAQYAMEHLVRVSLEEFVDVLKTLESY